LDREEKKKTSDLGEKGRSVEKEHLSARRKS